MHTPLLSSTQALMLAVTTGSYYMSLYYKELGYRLTGVGFLLGLDWLQVSFCSPKVCISFISGLFMINSWETDAQKSPALYDLHTHTHTHTGQSHPLEQSRTQRALKWAHTDLDVHGRHPHLLSPAHTTSPSSAASGTRWWSVWHLWVWVYTVLQFVCLHHLQMEEMFFGLRGSQANWCTSQKGPLDSCWC